jgi:hypothetical protein
MGASALIYAAPFQIKGAIGSRWLSMALASLKVNWPPNNVKLGLAVAVFLARAMRRSLARHTRKEKPAPRGTSGE